MYAIELEGRIRVGSESIGILEPVRIVLDGRYDTKEQAEVVIQRVRKAVPSRIKQNIVEVAQ